MSFGSHFDLKREPEVVFRVCIRVGWFGELKGDESGAVGGWVAIFKKGGWVVLRCYAVYVEM